MEKKLYLSELMSSKNYEIKNDQMNVIIAPCGSGKTYYINTHWLQSEQTVIYVSNTTALKEQVMRDYGYSVAQKLNISTDNVLVEKESKYGSFLTWSSEVYHDPDFSRLNTIFITFQGLVNRLDNGTLFLDEFALLNGEKTVIILDEAHDIPIYSQKFDNELIEGQYNGTGYYKILDFIESAETYKKYLIIGLTATPQSLELITYHDVLGEDKQLLKSYEEKQVIHYSEQLNNVLDKLEINEKSKVIVFESGSIENMIALTEDLRDKGYNISCLWSKNNKHKYSDRQRIIYNELTENGNISLVDVLILNSAFESGINIYDPDVKFVIYDYELLHQSETSLIQTRQRVRHDIELLLIRSRKDKVKKIDRDFLHETEQTKKRIAILSAAVGKRLTTEEFKALCKDLDFKRSGRKLITTSTMLNPLLAEIGFKIEDKKTDGIRYKTIIPLT